MSTFGRLAVVVTTVSWLGVIVLLWRTARFQIHTERRLAELEERDKLLTNYVKVLKAEHRAAQRVMGSWSPTNHTPSDPTLGNALRDLATAVAEVDAEEIRHLPEQPP